MSRLEEIKNEYAISKGFKDFWELYYASNFAETKDYISKIMDKYATECVKASLEKASKNPKFSTVEIWCGSWDKYVITDFRLNQESITNPDNFISIC